MTSSHDFVMFPPPPLYINFLLGYFKKISFFLFLFVIPAFFFYIIFGQFLLTITPHSACAFALSRLLTQTVYFIQFHFFRYIFFSTLPLFSLLFFMDDLGLVHLSINRDGGMILPCQLFMVTLVFHMITHWKLMVTF